MMRFNLEALEARENPAAGFAPRVPAELWQNLAADVRTLVEGATRPSPEAVQAFVVTTWTAFSDGAISPTEAAQITQTAQVVLTEANVTPAELMAVVVDVRAIHAALGATR
ncbi:MAG: hypothetical protein J0I06_26260 [Planctomycetes bacterium]|nr:hypothetical protein [Planctomycetota bacterium]